MRLLATLALLIGSNVFMTVAWYGHLKKHSLGMMTAILLSWGIAFFEYCLQVPANRIGYGLLTAYQLKIIQEGITFGVFILFAWLYLGEPLKPKYIVSMLLMVGAVWVAFYGD